MVTSDASACVKIIDTHNWRVRNNANKRIGVNVVPFTNAQGVAFPANVNIPWKNYTCSSSGSTAANRPINSAGVSDGSTNALGGAHTVARAGGRACCPLSNPMLQLHRTVQSDSSTALDLSITRQLQMHNMRMFQPLVCRMRM